MRNKLVRIVTENYDVFNQDFKKISFFRKMRCAFMSVSDSIFFYGNLVLAGILAGKVFFPKEQNLSTAWDVFLMSSLALSCLNLLITPVLTGLFDKYSSIEKILKFTDVKKIYKKRLCEKDLSLESLKVLSKNLKKEEMKAIFKDDGKINFNSIYFTQIKKDKEILNKNLLSEKSKNKKEVVFDKLINSLYEKEN